MGKCGLVAPPRRAPPSFRDCPMAVVAFVRKYDSPELGNQPASLATGARRAAVRVLPFLLFPPPPPISMLSNQIERFVPLEPPNPAGGGGEEHHLDERAPVVTCRSSQQSPVPPPHPTGSGFGFVQPSHFRGRPQIVSECCCSCNKLLVQPAGLRGSFGRGQERRGDGA